MAPDVEAPNVEIPAGSEEAASEDLEALTLKKLDLRALMKILQLFPLTRVKFDAILVYHYKQNTHTL